MRSTSSDHSPRTIAFTALFLFLTVLNSAADAAAAHKDTGKRIDAILARPEVAHSFWGVEIAELDSGQVLYSHDADRLFAPASDAKLFVTAAALALIGPDYRFHTTVETAAFPDKYGRVGGDLVLVGRGDPNISGRMLPYHLKTERLLPPAHVLEELADQVAGRGVKYIDGDVIADDSYYSNERYAVGWTEGDLTWEYGAPVSALALNDNVVYVSILPGQRVGDRAFLGLNPFADYFEIENRLVTTPAGSGPRKLAIQRDPGSNHIAIWGTIPIDDEGVSEALAIEAPAEFCARLFRDLLAKRDVVVYGHARARHASAGSEPSALLPGGASQPSTAPRVVLAEHNSLPFGMDVTVTNKVSQNLHAEMMLRLLGREKGSGGSITGGLDVLRGFLTTAGLQPQEYALYDGCGLSRQDLVSPHAIVKLLRYAARQSWGADYMNSLPIAGQDGTLALRLTTLPVGTVIRAKSGAFEHVNSLSGYMTTPQGQKLVFSIIGNNHTLTGRQAIEIIDEIVREAEQLHN
jgi:D-alanyl-D-alanine carboxypeptidase/D-alanyl-D-alanine-endopeptidase (penicillin-binding protein 4)